MTDRPIPIDILRRRRVEKALGECEEIVNRLLEIAEEADREGDCVARDEATREIRKIYFWLKSHTLR